MKVSLVIPQMCSQLMRREVILQGLASIIGHLQLFSKLMLQTILYMFLISQVRVILLGVFGGGAGNSAIYLIAKM